MFSRTTDWPDHFALDIDGEPVAIAVKPNARSRSYRLTIGRTGKPSLSVPLRGRVREVEAFLEKQRHWLAARLARAPKPKPFVEGAIFPLRGEEIRIVGTSQLRGTISVIKGDIPRLLVPGGPEHMARRLTDWLKAEALTDLKDRTGFHAERLGVKPAAITLRSQSSRWGSCSSSKRLNYNWRLILAPPFVLDYVAAHEVAHLREMNHSDRFWALVEQTLPDMARGQAWLKAHGADLMTYGVEVPR
ncbi:MAG: M48 family metallopeptidase [Hyphomicrobiaceae bacterium]|nr:M48 family metallopeptidase [Hyphomicrobiaceae bacterium]MCC0024273.1 M48 family metallopeptidase [Hyphomicrobiaceae bacterium]